MKIKKDQALMIRHSRKGTFIGIADRDFDTEEETFYPISLADKEVVEGIATYWSNGDSIPCRDSLCKIELIGN